MKLTTLLMTNGDKLSNQDWVIVIAGLVAIALLTIFSPKIIAFINRITGHETVKKQVKKEIRELVES